MGSSGSSGSSSPQSSSSCCFSLFHHLPTIQHKVTWLGDATTTKSKRDKTNNNNEEEEDTTTSLIYRSTTTTAITHSQDDDLIVNAAAADAADDDDDDDDDDILMKQGNQESMDVVNNNDPRLSNQKRMVLMEIVGAMGLETKHRHKVDPYCIVRQYDHHRKKVRIIHRTDTIYNDPNPIYTIQSQSLCLIEIPIEGNENTLSQTSVTNNKDTQINNYAIYIDIYHGNSQLDNITTSLQDFVTSSTSVPSSIVQDVVITNTLLPKSLLPVSLLGQVQIPYTEIIHHCESKTTNATNEVVDRIEYPLIVSPSTQRNEDDLITTTTASTIAVRLRYATAMDIMFIKKLTPQGTEGNALRKENDDNTKTTILSSLSNSLFSSNRYGKDGIKKDAADVHFQNVPKKSLTMKYKKKNQDNIDLYRVVPYPEPQRIETTTWMTATDMDRMSYESSTKWVSVGNGVLGTIYCEIIGCNDLPSLDSTDFTLTDPVVAIAFEDNFVRTDVIWDQLHPRWMPWTTRAFQFHIRHPSSVLCISVLDYDDNLLDMQHDPIGRVVIQPSNFKPNITYTLHYALQDDPNEMPISENIPLIDDEFEDENYEENVDMETTQRLATKGRKPGDGISKSSTRGTIIIRLRIEWVNECVAMKMYYTTVPRYIINVDSDKTYKALTYTTRGVGYMHTVSIRSVKVLAHEVMEYGSRFCYTMDVLMGIILWRGRYHITNTNSSSIWFPIHSIALFVGMITLVERPDWIVPIALYSIAYVLLSINYYGSSHPNPWLRVTPYMETICLTIFGRRTILQKNPSTTSNDPHGTTTTTTTSNILIASHQGSIASLRQEKLDQLKAARMSALISATISFLLKVYNIYSKTGNKSIKITTTEHRNSTIHQWNILSKKLKYIHMFLLYLCQYLRLGRNFTSWKSNYTGVVTSYCLIVAILWCILPISTIVHWIIRIIVLICFGPWMKLIDIWYTHSWYATKDELLTRINQGEYTVRESDIPDFDELLQNKMIHRMIHLGRIKAEELYQLRDMRQLLFGQYSEYIPLVDNSRYPSIPLPQSTATATAASSSTSSEWNRSKVSYHVPGQLLFGNMIHTTDDTVPELVKESATINHQ